MFSRTVEEEEVEIHNSPHREKNGKKNLPHGSPHTLSGVKKAAHKVALLHFNHSRLLFPTQTLCSVATRMKGTAWGEVDRAWNLSSGNNLSWFQLLFLLRDNRDGRKEHLGIGMERSFKEDL
jgi:hypothetical protein